MENQGHTPKKKEKADFFYLATLNARTLRTENKMNELKLALSTISWDVVGVSETRILGESIIEQPDGDLFSYIGTTRGLYGVGFLIKNKWKKHVIEIKNFSERITLLKLNVENTTVSILQIYAPTSAATEANIEHFYQNLDFAKNYMRGEIQVVMGDFNGRVGQRNPGEEPIMGPYCFGIRNLSGERLIQWIWQNKLSICNTLFKKKNNRKWTWKSPNNEVFEIDYVLINNKNVVKDVDVLNNFKFDSDHRLVRVKLLINHQTKRSYRTKEIKFNQVTDEQQAMYKTNLLQRKLILQNIPNLTLQKQYDQFEASIKAASNFLQTVKQKSTSKFTPRTTLLMERRTLLKRKRTLSADEITELKLLRKNIADSQKEDIESFNTRKVTEILSSTKSITKAKQMMNPDKQWLLALQKNDTDVTKRMDINEVATQFYSELFSTTENSDQIELPESFEKEPEFLVSEIGKAIKGLGNEKSGGSDNIKAELLKFGSTETAEWLTALFNEVLKTTTIPSQWKISIIILLHKKGDKRNIQNYRPISLISTIYKIFAKCLLERMKPILEINQPPEQAAFRRGFSTIDHLHTINQLIEKSCEYNIPVYLAFIDFTKAFDSISHHSIWKALLSQGIPVHFIKIIRGIYENSTAFVKTDTTGKTFSIKRGVRQGDPLSPALFSAVLEGIFRKMNWENVGVRVQGKWLSNLRFADDIVLISTNPTELQMMLNDLSRECAKVGLQMNRSKTKLMTSSSEVPISYNSELLEYVEDFIYLGQVVSFKNRGKKETARRVTNAWNQFWNVNHLFKLRLPIQQKKEIFDSSIVSVLNYASQTRSQSKKETNTIEVCQRAMERSILNIRRTDRIRNEDVRSRTNFADAVILSKRQKWDWAGHVFRLQDGRWTSLITDWTPLDCNRNSGRQMKRWKDDLRTHEPNYRRIANDRSRWKELREHF